MAKQDSGGGAIRGETQPTYDMPKDARESGSDYPNYWIRKTRSGHVFMLDDSKDKEQITLQHRSGSMLQFMPDGAVQSVVNRGRFDTTFGEHRSKVTGATDLTTKSRSARVEENDNTTVIGNSTTAINQHQAVIVGKTMAMAAGERIAFGAQTVGIKGTAVAMEGSKISMKSKDIGAITSEGTIGVKGVKGTGIHSDNIAAMEGKLIGLTTQGGAKVAMFGNEIHFNSLVEIRIADIPDVSTEQVADGPPDKSIPA